MYAIESAVLEAWYGSRPEVRRLLALKDADGLRVLLELEPAQDSSETNPAWWANRREWTNDLIGRTGSAVRLERVDDIEISHQELVVAELSWRDPLSS
jgi:hypothetical protein